jgi:predicted nucleic acid-binding protein
VILVDSSAWIELLRETGGPAHGQLRSALERREPLAWTDVVAMELLAGARDAADRDRLRRLLFGRHFLPVDGPADYESAISTGSAAAGARRRASSPTA